MRKRELKKVYPLLDVLARLNTNDRKTVIKFLNDQGYEAIYECIYNGLDNNDVSTTDRKFLRKGLLKDQNIYRQLLLGSRVTKRKKKHIEQVGGSLGLLLATVLPILSNFLSTK